MIRSLSVDWNALSQQVQGCRSDVELGVSVIAPDGSRWQHNGDLVFASASTAKIAIMVAIHRMLDRGDVTLDTAYVLRDEDKAGGSGVLRHLRRGLRLTLADLLYLMIAISDNTATNQLIRIASMAEINATMKSLGMSRSALSRLMVGRLAIDGEQENLASANDYATLMQAIIAGKAATRASCQAMMSLLSLQQNRHRIARYVPSDERFRWGSKNGTNPGITHDVGFVSLNGETMVIAVYISGIDDEVCAEQLIADIALAAMRSALNVPF